MSASYSSSKRARKPYLEVDAADITGGLGDEDGGERGGRVRDGGENLGLHDQRVAILVVRLGGLPLPLGLRGTGLLVSGRLVRKALRMAMATHSVWK